MDRCRIQRHGFILAVCNADEQQASDESSHGDSPSVVYLVERRWKVFSPQRSTLLAFAGPRKRFLTGVGLGKPALCYLASAIRALPTMTSGIPLVNSRTLGSEARKLDYDRLRDDLKAAESTEVGFALIGEGQLNRSELERLARSLDLPVLRQDSVRRLEQKIVKALIGSRLNSRSVRGK
jgi:hypothetical protein